MIEVVVSKLKRFSANDRSDISAMVALDLVPHDQLLRRFHNAVDRFSFDARADDLPKYIRHLNEVERDEFDVEESVIELPDWV